MRTFYHIDLGDQSVKKQQLEGEEIIRAGRYLIAKTLVEQNIATVDPLSKDNPLIFSAGPFAGSNFSNANRLSVGCKSPLTGGIKEPTPVVPSVLHSDNLSSQDSHFTTAVMTGLLFVSLKTVLSALTQLKNSSAWEILIQQQSCMRNMAAKSASVCAVWWANTKDC